MVLTVGSSLMRRREQLLTTSPTITSSPAVYSLTQLLLKSRQQHSSRNIAVWNHPQNSNVPLPSFAISNNGIGSRPIERI
jgi:hypothetical protein